jgi:GTP-binding protein
VSFRREKFIERGGPNGGDGGDGGDVILVTDPSRRTLYQYRHQKFLRAKNGMPGEGSNRHGKNGADVTVPLPPGTIVSNADTGEVIKDFTAPDETFVVARGGRGGQGNKRFATSRNRAPRFAQPGIPGETLNLKLELKIIADVGIIGFPNAGKSTLISGISAARPKVGNYPFTTLTPNIGMVTPPWGEPFAVADIPGLVEGAHGGTGLGIQFLRHVERTRFLVHLVDLSEVDPEDPLERFDAINRELSLYSERLAAKAQLIVLNKIDIPGSDAAASAFEAALAGTEVLRISAASGEGVDALKIRLAEMVQESDEE